MSDKVKSLEELFLQDVISEEKFKNGLGKDVPADLKDEITLMTTVYNEMLDGLVRCRFDAEIFRVFEKVDPIGGGTPEEPNKTWGVRKAENDKLIVIKRAMIQVIREQLLRKIELSKKQHAD